jgi:hypothetical protein
MTEWQKASLENKAIIVQSDFEDTIYAIHKDCKGLSLIVGNKEILIHADNVEALALEMLDVWRVWGKK